MQHKNTDLHHYDSHYTVSTGTQHILYLFNSLRMISTFIQVYYAIMRYSESVDKSGR